MDNLKRGFSIFSLGFLILVFLVACGGGGGGPEVKNLAPIAQEDAIVTNDRSPVRINVVANDFDEDGDIDSGSVTIVIRPENGTTDVGLDGTIVYMPNPGFAGTDTFSYSVKDKEGAPSNEATVSVRVNKAPVAVDDFWGPAQSLPGKINLIANDNDADGVVDPKTVAIAVAPTKGSFKVYEDGSVEYFPSVFFDGRDTFVYTVEDDLGATSNRATVTIVANSPPRAVDDSAYPQQGVAINIDLVSNDVDTDGNIVSETLTILTGPSHGILITNRDGSVEYTSYQEFNGLDTFTYSVKDDLGATSNVATVTVSVNAPPLAEDDWGITTENTLVRIDVIANDTDRDGAIDENTVRISSGPQNGTLAVHPNGHIDYSPNSDFHGLDMFSYRMDDDQGAISNEAVVTVLVNALPVALDDSAFSTEGLAAVLDLLANDTDVDGGIVPDSIKIVKAPSMGSVTVFADGTIDYLPFDSIDGTDSFTYTVEDDLGATSNEATVTIIGNFRPRAVDDGAVPNQGATIAIDLLANDSDADGSLVPEATTIVSPPGQGKLTLFSGGVAEYAPDAGFYGIDTFTYFVRDDRGAKSNEATVTISVNAQPVAKNDRISTFRNSKVIIGVATNDADPDGVIVLDSIEITSPPSNGGVEIFGDGTIWYTPAADYYGGDEFGYRVEDDLGATSNEAKVAIMVLFPPVASDGCWTTPQELVLEGRLQAIDEDNNQDEIVFSIVDEPQKGLITHFDPNSGEFEYTPFKAGGRGRDVFVFNVEDPHGGVDTGVATIIINPKIMPLGDSITYGYLSADETPSNELVTGYRQPLFLSLKATGYNVDFVGSLESGQAASPSFDPSHEGHAGWRDDEIATHIYDWLNLNPADIVLIHIGTNGLETTPRDVDHILEEIDRFNPEITVILAKIINRKTHSEITAIFNANIDEMARHRVAGGDRIILVDMEGALNYLNDMNDELHPNKFGYEKISDVWFEAIIDQRLGPEILDKCP